MKRIEPFIPYTDRSPGEKIPHGKIKFANSYIKEKLKWDVDRGEKFDLIDGELIFDGDIVLEGQGKKIDMKLLPNIIKGNCYLQDNKITNLQGGPQEVYGHFDIGGNRIASIMGGPIIVGGSYFVRGTGLQNFKGAPLVCNKIVSYSKENKHIEELNKYYKWIFKMFDLIEIPDTKFKGIPVLVKQKIDGISFKTIESIIEEKFGKNSLDFVKYGNGFGIIRPKAWKRIAEIHKKEIDPLSAGFEFGLF